MWHVGSWLEGGCAVGDVVEQGRRVWATELLADLARVASGAASGKASGARYARALAPGGGWEKKEREKREGA
jgi:hypothetical protein